jgi:hypothetical protein
MQTEYKPSHKKRKDRKEMTPTEKIKTCFSKKYWTFWALFATSLCLATIASVFPILSDWWRLLEVLGGTAALLGMAVLAWCIHPPTPAEKANPPWFITAAVLVNIALVCASFFQALLHLRVP